MSHPLKFAEGGAASVDLIEGWASPQKNGAAPKGLRHPVFSLYIQEYGDKEYGDRWDVHQFFYSPRSTRLIFHSGCTASATLATPQVVPRPGRSSE